MNDLLKRLSEAVPELSIEEYNLEVAEARTLLIAAIRDWIVLQDGIFRVDRFDMRADGKEHFLWIVHTTSGEEIEPDVGGDDELKVAIECALAVKEKME